jgi:hypothetical protein
MIEPIGTSLIFSGPSLLPGGPSLIQSGARRQPVLWRSPDPWSSADVSTFDGHFALSLRRNHICHFHIFIRNTEISLKFYRGIAIMFYGALSLAPSNPSF